MRAQNLAAGAAVATLLAISAIGTGAVVAGTNWEVDPSIRLAPDAQAALTGFRRFMSETTGISPQFRDGGGVATAVRRGASYEPQQFSEGMILYAAMAAMADPDFVEAVQARADEVGRQALVEELSTYPAAAARLPGARDAAARAAAALRREGDALIAAGASVKQASYDLQRQPWSTAFAPNAARLLAEVKALGAARPDGGQAAVVPVSARGYARQVAPAGTVDRGLALAALMVLGESADGDRARALEGDIVSGQCLRMAKLNYHQCLAAAGPHYEGVYCVAVHAMMDPGKCVITAAR